MKLFINLTLIFLMLVGCSTGEDEVYIIPKGYTGYVVIIYNQKTGLQAKRNGKKRLYEVPPTGILKTQFDNNPGWTSFPDFYYESVSPENRIVFKADPSELPNDTIVAYGGSAGNANKDLAGKETVSFKLYYIGNKAQIDTAYEQAEKLDIVRLAD